MEIKTMTPRTTNEAFIVMLNALDLKDTEVAKILGVSRQRVSHIINNTYKLGVRSLVAYGEKLGFTVDVQQVFRVTKK